METPSIPRPPFDPALEKARVAFPPDAFKSVQALRSQPDPFTLESFLKEYPNLTHTERTIPGPPSNPSDEITLSIFQRKPAAATNTNTNADADADADADTYSDINGDSAKLNRTLRPAIYNIHGGGQIAGTRFSGISFLAPWFMDLDVIFITVEYRLAPEHRAPAALEDSCAGLSWVFASAEELGIDRERILLVGVSGGAPIAAGCAMRAASDYLRAEKRSKESSPPHLCGQLLSTPMLDDRVNTISSNQYMSDGGPWNAETNRMAWDCVLGPENRGTDCDPVTPLISPARATPKDLADLATSLPPAFIDVGAAEVFRDEAVAYASVLWESGVPAELHVWPGAWHGFDAMAPDADVSRAAREVKRGWIRRVLGVC